MKKLGDPLSFYKKVISEDFVNSLLESEEVASRAGIFTASVVIWLMICQRLNPDHSLEKALQSLRDGVAEGLLEDIVGSIRARHRRISKGTGGYSQARSRVPVGVVEQVADRLTESIISTHDRVGRERYNIYVIDGSSVQISHTANNLSRYPVSRNQHGEAHYPLVRLCVATNVENGVCLRPAYGALNGSEAVSELQLSEELLLRLPKSSIVIGDRYFGCFRFAALSVRNGHRIICRMKEDNAVKFIGKPKSASGEQEIDWTPSSHEQKKYADPHHPQVKGRIIWHRLSRKGYRTENLVLFTTLDLPASDIVEIYGLRWNVETDLRDIKSTLDMNFIDAKSPDMIAKELILGICAYNLIRHMIDSAADASKIRTRNFSFSKVLRLVNSIAFVIIENRSDAFVQKYLRDELTNVQSLLLPSRRATRDDEPRRIWRRGGGTAPYFSDSRKNEQKKLKESKKIYKNNGLRVN